MTYGFTGTHKGLTSVQDLQLIRVLGLINKNRRIDDQICKCGDTKYHHPVGGYCNGCRQCYNFQLAQTVYEPISFHHGDCIGADATAHDYAANLKFHIVIHPPLDAKARAFKPGKVLECKPYLVRNHDIVDVADTLIACPDGPERLRSGTWATVRYALRQRKQVYLIWPDGKLQTLKSRVKV